MILPLFQRSSKICAVRDELKSTHAGYAYAHIYNSSSARSDFKLRQSSIAGGTNADSDWDYAFFDDSFVNVANLHEMPHSQVAGS
jgi:hypothetical protein